MNFFTGKFDNNDWFLEMSRDMEFPNTSSRSILFSSPSKILLF